MAGHTKKQTHDSFIGIKLTNCLSADSENWLIIQNIKLTVLSMLQELKKTEKVV